MIDVNLLSDSSVCGRPNSVLSLGSVRARLHVMLASAEEPRSLDAMLRVCFLRIHVIKEYFA